MKRINFRLFAFFVVLLSVFSNQVVFADIIIRKDDSNPTVQPNALVRVSSMSISSKTVIPVTANVVGSELFVDFTSTVGTAYVSIVDQSGSVVYQTSVDTYSTSELVIPIDDLSTGKYSLKISYGSTKLTGDFQL